MKNQVKLFAANLILAAVSFAVVGGAQANAQTLAHASTVKATVVNYLSQVGQQDSDVFSPINFI